MNLSKNAEIILQDRYLRFPRTRGDRPLPPHTRG